MSDDNIIEFKKRTEQPESNSAEGVVTPPNSVQEKLVLAADIGLDEVVIVGSDGDMIHFIHSEMTAERIIYLLEKMKAMILREEYEEYN